MTNEQRAAALRLADELESVARNTWSNNDAAELLRALAAEPVAKRKLINMCLGCGDTPHPGFPCAEAQALREPVAEPVAWRWMYGHGLQPGALFEMPGPDADIIASAASAEYPRTVQYLYAAPPQDTALREAADDVLTFCGDVVDGWESLAPLRVRSAASESLLRLKAALEAK